MRYLIISLMIHSMFFLTCLDLSPEQKQQKKTGTGDSPIRVRITEKKVPKKQLQDDVKEFIPLADKGNLECKHFYYGIGYQVRALTGLYCEIDSVAPGSPAAKAGLKAGDKIQVDSNMDCPGRGNNGEPIFLNVLIDGEMKQLTLVRKKICTA